MNSWLVWETDSWRGFISLAIFGQFRYEISWNRAVFCVEKNEKVSEKKAIETDKPARGRGFDFLYGSSDFVFPLS